MVTLFRAQLVVFILLIAGTVLAAPAVGVRGSGALQSLYGVTINEPNLLLLMRHRAVLFGGMGLLLIASVWLRTWRVPAILSALLSLVAFCILFTVDDSNHNAALERLFRVDLALIAALGLALGLHWHDFRRLKR